MQKIITDVKLTNRIQYIDALRGFAMLLVVFVHVEIFGFFNFSHTTFLGKFFSAVHMPTFFFISGLCMYKPNATYTGSRIFKDVLRLIIPAFIVGLIYTYIKIDKNYFYFLSNSMKAGYWFTISLFEIFLIYYLVYILLKRNEKLFDLVLILVSVFLFILKLPLKTIPLAETIGNLLCLHQTCNFFLFFALGILAAKYRDSILVLIVNKWVSMIVFLMLMTSSLFMFKFYGSLHISGVKEQIVSTIGETAVGFWGVICLYMLFYYYKSFFSETNIVGKSLIIIGNNTLAIYLIHYFILPNLPMIGTFLKSYPNIICELCICLPLSLIIIVISMGIAKIIRVSPILSSLLLGDMKK